MPPLTYNRCDSARFASAISDLVLHQVFLVISIKQPRDRGVMPSIKRINWSWATGNLTLKYVIFMTPYHKVAFLRCTYNATSQIFGKGYTRT